MASAHDDDHELRFIDGQIRLRLNAACHRAHAAQKSAYRFAERFSLVVGPAENGDLPIVLLFPPATSAKDAMEATREFLRELVDQELRERIGEETRAMRALILAHAFSKTNLVRRD